MVRRLEAGENLHHAGDLLRFQRIHGFDDAVGYGGVDDAGE